MKMKSLGFAQFRLRSNLKRLASQKQAALKNELSFTMCLINLIKRTLPKVAHITLELQSKLKGKEDVNIRAPRR